MKRPALKRKLFHLFVPVFTLLAGSIILSSCYYDNEEYLYPPSGQKVFCDSLSPTYNTNIATIFVDNGCNNYNCHSSASHPNTDVITDNYDDLIANIDKVWNSINFIGSHPMPKYGGKLSDCDLAKIRQWRNLGMPRE